MADTLSPRQQMTIKPELGNLGSFFEASPTPYLILLPDAPNFTIADANPAYIAATHSTPENLIGRSLFDIFSENPPPHIALGIENLRASLRRVIAKNEAHSMAPQQYSIELPGNDLPMLKYCNAVNVPLHEEGQLKYIIHSFTNIIAPIPAPILKEDEEDSFRSLIEQAHVATALYTGPEMRIKLANEAMVQLWGKDSSVIGKTLSEALPELSGQPFHELLEKVYTTGETYEAKEDRADLMVNGRLRTFYFNFTYKALHNNRGVIYGVLNMAVDVTEQVLNRRKIELGQERYRALSAELETRVLERTRELEEANANMVRSNSELEQFAYVASHDLQEPLRKIRAFGDILQTKYKAQLPVEGGEMIGRMQAAVDRMKTLIEDLLAFSRVSSNVKFKKDVDLEVIIQGVISDLYAAVTERNSIIHIKGLQPVNGDPLQFRQLFQNLLSNSLKFNHPDRRPEIFITGKMVKGADSGFQLTRTEARKDFLLVEVCDNGVGFEQQYSERIFQIFQRLQGRSQYPGSGIGLSIVKKVVDNHYGYIKAVSSPGEGATFRFILPA